MKRCFDVLLCGYYGFGNLGDELLAGALVALFEEKGVPRERMAILSGSPEKSREAFGIEAFDRWSPSALFRALSRSRSLLLGGGGLFQDTTSLRSPFYYWAVVRMAALLGCVPWCLGQSVGPLRSTSGAWLARNALRRCSVRYVRDEGSRSLLQQWGIDSEISPDLVLSLSLLKPEGPKSYILVNMRSWYGNLPERFARVLAAFSQAEGKPLLGVALVREDVRIMEGLKADGLLPEGMAIRLLEPGNLSEIFGQGSIAVGMRLHFNVLALIHGLSCIAVPYDPKVVSFAKDWDIPAWTGNGPLPAKGGQPASAGKLEQVRRAVRKDFEAAWSHVKEETFR